MTRAAALAACVAVLALAGCAGGEREGSRITDCMDPAEARSADVRRNLGRLKGAPVCYRRQEVNEGGFQWVFHILEHTKAPDGPFWVLPHDNENAAFDAGLHALLTYGGGLLAVDAGGGRSYRGQDPNRNFSTSREEARICRSQRHPAPLYTRAILAHYTGRRGPYLALHNNGDGHGSNGGEGNISMHRDGPDLSQRPGARVGSAALRDEDNLVLMAGLRPLGADPAAHRRVAELNRAGLNVMYKQVTPTNLDCSLSDHIAWHRLGDYYNLEAEHGAVATQIEMVDRLMATLGVRPLRQPNRANPFLE